MAPAQVPVQYDQSIFAIAEQTGQALAAQQRMQQMRQYQEVRILFMFLRIGFRKSLLCLYLWIRMCRVNDCSRVILIFLCKRQLAQQYQIPPVPMPMHGQPLYGQQPQYGQPPAPQQQGSYQQQYHQ
jgi:hypothetical protein